MGWPVTDRMRSHVLPKGLTVRGERAQTLVMGKYTTRLLHRPGKAEKQRAGRRTVSYKVVESKKRKSSSERVEGVVVVGVVVECVLRRVGKYVCAPTTRRTGRR